MFFIIEFPTPQFSSIDVLDVLDILLSSIYCLIHYLQENRNDSFSEYVMQTVKSCI